MSQGTTNSKENLQYDNIITDQVTEKTAAAGVTVDGALIKDGAFEGIVESKCIDIVQLSNLGIVSTDTDAITFDFVPSKIVIFWEYMGTGTGAGNVGGTRGQTVITITGTNTFTSNTNSVRGGADGGSPAFAKYAQNDTTYIIAGYGGADTSWSSITSTGAWVTSTKTLTLTYTVTNSVTAANFVALVATAYK